MSKQMISIKHALACNTLSNSIFNLSWISLMVFGRIWSYLCRAILRYEIIEKDKLDDFYASKFKLIASNEFLLRLIFALDTDEWDSVCVFFFERPNLLDYKCFAIYPSVINSYAREFDICIQTSEIFSGPRHLYHTFYLLPNRILSICLSVNQCIYTVVRSSTIDTILTWILYDIFSRCVSKNRKHFYVVVITSKFKSTHQFLSHSSSSSSFRGKIFA